MPTLFIPGQYENPLTAEGRARTIAAFHVAQGNASTLSDAEMRRDMLDKMMSPSAINYWLKTKGWLEITRKIGRKQLLRLTPEGLQTCANSAAGGSDTPTHPELIERRRQLMSQGGPNHARMDFPDLAP